MYMCGLARQRYVCRISALATGILGHVHRPQLQVEGGETVTEVWFRKGRSTCTCSKLIAVRTIEHKSVHTLTAAPGF